jgi:hypothetical protein
MACVNCLRTNIVPACTDELIIGTIQEIAPINIFVKNLTTGFVYLQQADSISLYGYGSVILDMNDPDKSFYNPNSSYEIWVTLQDDTEKERLSISVGDEDADCITVSFEKYYGDLPIVFESHQLTVEA